MSKLIGWSMPPIPERESLIAVCPPTYSETNDSRHPSIQVNVHRQTTAFGPKSQFAICPRCNDIVQTRIKRKATTRTHNLAAKISGTWWCCCCAFMPYCVPSCLSTLHYCSGCGLYLGVYES